MMSWRFWVNYNACNVTPSETIIEDSDGDGLGGTLSVYNGCMNDVSVELYYLDGLRHQWPSLGENVRYEAGEKKNDESLSKQIADLCDVYVMDAFGASHREHSSTYGALKYAKEGCIGPLLSKEVSSIRKAIDDPQAPVTAIIGGAKVSSKLGVIEKFSSFCDHVIVGGGIANTFLLASGKEVGASLVEPEMVDAANRILEMENVNVPLPVDVSQMSLNMFDLSY